jgi:hypothetical protein
MLPLKITLISSMWSSLSGLARRCSPRCGSCAAGCAGIFLRSKKVLHSSRSCLVVQWISHHISTSAGRWNNLFSFCSMGYCLRFPRSAVLSSRSSCYFFVGDPLLHYSRSHALASEASMHTSATASRSSTVLGFFMAISSIVLTSLTPSQKALMILMSWMYEITFLTLQKCFT